MSDLLIKGMKMPESCAGCYMFLHGITMKGNPWHICAAADRGIDNLFGFGKPDWCPLVEVPPHGRLADIDAVISVLEEMSKEYPPDSIGRHWISIFSDILKAAPTVIPASEEGETLTMI